jgi:hypothetical protein
MLIGSVQLFENQHGGVFNLATAAVDRRYSEPKALASFETTDQDAVRRRAKRQVEGPRHRIVCKTHGIFLVSSKSGQFLSCLPSKPQAAPTKNLCICTQKLVTRTKSPETRIAWLPKFTRNPFLRKREIGRVL